MTVAPRATRALVALVLLALLVIGATTAAAAPAPFTQRFAANAPGDVAIVGNTVLSCATAATGCAAARAGGAAQNNGFAMAFVDADADATTFNSSTADLALPPGATVLFAGLYWGAKAVAGGGGAAAAAPNPAATGTVKLTPPGAAGYAPLAGTIIGTTPDSGLNYQAFADITALVAASGSGTYGVADVQAGRGTNTWGGWSLVVAYRDPAAPYRNLTVSDGYQFVAASNPAVTIPVSGFITPPSGPVRVRLGVVAYDGDKGSPGSTFLGDTLRLGTAIVTDPLNPANDFFNSTIGREGTRFAAKAPDYVNQLGFDADVVTADGLLANGQTATTIGLVTGGESYYPGVVTTAIDLFAPTLTSTKTVTDLDGGAVEPGDVLEYAISLTNTGLDAATGVRVTDAIPVGTTYEPGSLAVTAGAGTGPLTDGAGDDAGEFAGGGVVARLGTGATATAGGRLGIGESTAMRFRVTVATVPADTVIPNAAGIEFAGETTGTPFSDATAPVTVTVAGVPLLTATKGATLADDADGSGGVSAGDTLSYRVLVTNSGNQAATGVVVADTLDPLTTLLAGSVTTTAGTVTSGAAAGQRTVQVAVGTLLPGASVTITFRARIAASLPTGTTRILNQAVVTADGLVPVSTDDPVTVPAGDPTAVAIGGGTAPAARLAIDVTGPAVARSGAVVRYRIVVRNPSTVTARQVTVRIPVPAGTVVVRRPAGSRIVSGRVVWTTPVLAPGARRTLTLRLRVLGRPGAVRSPRATTVAANAAAVSDRARTRLVGRPPTRQPAVTG